MKDRIWAPGYRLGKILGKGGFAIVREGTHIESGRKVAIKLIMKGNIPEEKLFVEIDILRSLPLNPHVINMIEAFDFKDRIVIIVDLAKCGGSLFDRLQRRGTYSESIARNLVRQIIEAVQFLHENNIFHRDLKLENILFDYDVNSNVNKTGQIRITDFGLSARLEGENQIFSDKVGSPEYMAPEILRGQGYTKSVDLWCIGIITYSILGGTLPFYDLKKPVLYQMILSGVVQFKPPEWSKISDAGKDFICGLLQVDPQNRMTAQMALQHPWIVGKEPSSGNFNHFRQPPQHQVFQYLQLSKVNSSRSSIPIVSNQKLTSKIAPPKTIQNTKTNTSTSLREISRKPAPSSMLI